MFRGKCDPYAGRHLAKGADIAHTHGIDLAVTLVAALAIACGPGLSTPRAMPGSPTSDAGVNVPLDQRQDRQARDEVGNVVDMPSNDNAAEPSAGAGGVVGGSPSGDGGAPVGDTFTDATSANGSTLQMKQFASAVGGDFDFGAGRFTITSNTFEGPVTLTQVITPPPRPGPVALTHELSVSPRQKTKIPARIRLRIPADWKGDSSAWQLAYFKPKPSDPPGLWLVCSNAAPVSDERAFEGESPPFDNGVEHFALLRRCSGSTNTCEPPFVCLSGLCQ